MKGSGGGWMRWSIDDCE